MKENKKSKDWKSIIKSLSVEPAGFLIVCGAVVSHLIFQNLVMETACRIDLQYDEDTCKEIIKNVNASYKAEEKEIQKVVASVQAITSSLFGCVTVLVVLFVGPWSDRNGRKIPLLLSASGIFFFPCTMLIFYLLLEKLKLSALLLTMFVIGPITITGGASVYCMSAYSYIADTTTNKNRTVRTGVVSASVRSGTPIGFAIGGGLTKLGVGTVTSLIIAMGFGAGAFLILLLRVKNTIPGQDSEESKEIEEQISSTIVKKNKSAWKKYNPLRKLWQTLAILFKKRENKGFFLLLILCHICYAAPGSGEHSMLYLFVRVKLGWNLSDYGFFSMYNWLMSAAGVFLSMFILSRKFNVSDPIVGFVAGISQIGGSTLYAFASTALAMYLASAMDLMNGTMGVVVRSMLSKTVVQNETGKLFALLGVLESLLPILMVPTYAMTYRSTVSVFAGAFFLLSAAVTIPAEILFMYFICTNKGKAVKEANPSPINEAGVEEKELEDKMQPELGKLMPQKTGIDFETEKQSSNSTPY